MRKALCVGIDYYERFGNLSYCVSDARSVLEALERHADDSKNFDVEKMYAETMKLTVPMGIDPDTGAKIEQEETIGLSAVTTKALRAGVEELFETDKNLDVVLFYFAGHGYFDEKGGYLCTSDSERPTDGLPLDYVMKLAANCKANHKIIILDSCHSGYAGKLDRMGDYCTLPDNTIIMASCTERGTAADGCFTPLMVDALEGGAMNLMGEVSPGGIYSYIDRALGSWDQRPVFKANIEQFVCLRKNEPPIKLPELREITDIFEDPDKAKPLDPGYEEDKRDVKDPKYMEHDQEKERVFSILRNYAALNLVVPVDAPRMYQAAVYFKSCKLTNLGRYYWRLVRTKRI